MVNGSSRKKHSNGNGLPRIHIVGALNMGTTATTTTTSNSTAAAGPGSRTRQRRGATGGSDDYGVGGGHRNAAGGGGGRGADGTGARRSGSSNGPVSGQGVNGHGNWLDDEEDEDLSIDGDYYDRPRKQARFNRDRSATATGVSGGALAGASVGLASDFSQAGGGGAAPQQSGSSSRHEASWGVFLRRFKFGVFFFVTTFFFV